MVGGACGAAERWERLAGGWPEMRKVEVNSGSRGVLDEIKYGE